MGDNVLQKKGYGEWVVHLYNPVIEIGPFSGELTVSRDFHTINAIMEDDDMDEDNLDEVIASIPSPNVAYCVNTLVCPKYKDK